MRVPADASVAGESVGVAQPATRRMQEAFQVDMRGTQCPIGVPDRSGAKERMWFDYMIRAADWLAGAVSAWDRTNNLIPGEHDKYRQMLEDVITEADNIVILHFDITETGMQFRRILPTRKNWLMRIVTWIRNTAVRFWHWATYKLGWTV